MSVKLRIDTRYNRMCIHRQALKAIGDPSFLSLGYDPESKRLMVMSSIEDGKSLRVRHDSSGSVYVRSKPLLTGIRQVSHILEHTGTYLVEGKVWSSILVFPLSEARIFS